MENGKLPASELAPIAGGQLRADAAAGLNAMNVEARRRGLELRPTGSMSSYRTYAQQQILWQRYQAGTGNLAARPGTSNHGFGLAVDFATQQMRSTVDQIGAKYGWSKQWSDAPSEWWHVCYQPGHYSGGDPGPDGKRGTTSAGAMVTLFDSIDLAQIPANPEAVAGYVGGRWPTYNELVARFPHAHHLSIAVTAQQRARCLDIEPGDASPAQAPAWFRNLADHSQGPPVLYCSASKAAEVIATMDMAGIARGQYLIWSAHYTHAGHICSPSDCGYAQADATQWTDHALGRNLDQSLCSPAFFGTSSYPTLEDFVAVTAALNAQGALHVIYEKKDGSLWYTWQRQGESQWAGGKPGKQVAGLAPFAPAPK